MSMTPSPAAIVYARNGPYWLGPFDKPMAPVVASWPRHAGELFWLAPKTEPPLTAAKVVEWPGDSGCQILFHRDGLAEPLGYLELNPMPTEQRHFWLGHCVIQPDSRGVGLGRLMVDLALDEAFEHHLATSVSLVVFPDNVAAIRCYRAVGFVDAGHQVKYFHTTGRQHRMLRMTIAREQYELIRRQAPLS